jgi:hypothetical protein
MWPRSVSWFNLLFSHVSDKVLSNERNSKPLSFLGTRWQTVIRTMANGQMTEKMAGECECCGYNACFYFARYKNCDSYIYITM